MALRFGYPMRKRHKLLARKFDLANDDVQREDTLREMEEMVKRKLFSEKDMKCKNAQKHIVNTLF